MKGSQFNLLLKILKSTDWASTPIYHQFQRNGRWKNEDDKISSDIELQYNISYLNKFFNNENQEKQNDYEAKNLIDKYFIKKMHTLEVLMIQMNMMEKVQISLKSREKKTSIPVGGKKKTFQDEKLNSIHRLQEKMKMNKMIHEKIYC